MEPSQIIGKFYNLPNFKLRSHLIKENHLTQLQFLVTNCSCVKIIFGSLSFFIGLGGFLLVWDSPLLGDKGRHQIPLLFFPNHTHIWNSKDKSSLPFSNNKRKTTQTRKILIICSNIIIHLWLLEKRKPILAAVTILAISYL